MLHSLTFREYKRIHAAFERVFAGDKMLYVEIRFGRSLDEARCKVGAGDASDYW